MQLSEEILKQFILDTGETIRLKQGLDTLSSSGIVSTFSETGKHFPLMPLFRTVTSTEGTDVHRHDFLEIILILNGAGTHVIDGVECEARPGDVFFINTSKHHFYKASESAPLQYASFAFYPSMINPVITMQKLDAGLHYALIEPFFIEHKDKNCGWFHAEESEFFKLAMLSLTIIDLFNQGYPEGQEEVTDLFRSFIYILYKIYRRQTGDQEILYKKTEKVFWDLIREIEGRLSEKFTLDDIARSVGMGRTRISEIFKEIQGETITEYARRRRSEKAALLLSRSDMPILEVAYESGFHDLSYFNRTFKSYYHLSPSEYRLQNWVSSSKIGPSTDSL